MGTTVDDRNAILATMGVSEDDPDRTEILNNLGVMEDEDELRWFYQNDPEILERLNLSPLYEDNLPEEEKKASKLLVVIGVVVWGLLIFALFW